MRLSDIKGERAIDVIADIIEPIINISQDKEALALFMGIKNGKVTDAAGTLKKSVPMLLKTHKQDIIAILAAMKGVTSDEYVAEMSLAALIGDLYELSTDETFMTLFTSAQNDVISSVSARENTGDAASQDSENTQPPGSTSGSETESLPSTAETPCVISVITLPEHTAAPS